MRHRIAATGQYIFRLDIIFSGSQRLKLISRSIGIQCIERPSPFIIQYITHIVFFSAQDNAASSQRHASAYTFRTIGYRHIRRFGRYLQSRIQIHSATAALVFRIYPIIAGSIATSLEIQTAAGAQYRIQRSYRYSLHPLQYIIHPDFRYR